MPTPRVAWRFGPSLPCCADNPEPGRLGRCAFQASRGLCSQANIRGPCPVACEQCTLCAGHPQLATYERVRRGRRPPSCQARSLALHSIFVAHAFRKPGFSLRGAEYCAALSHNLEHPCVESVTLVGTEADSTIAALCNLTATQRARMRVSTVRSERQLTYATLLGMASAGILESTGKSVSSGAVAGDAPGTAALQVVLHADLKVGDWVRIPRDCMGRMRELKLAFVLSRQEPLTCLQPAEAKAAAAAATGGAAGGGGGAAASSAAASSAAAEARMQGVERSSGSMSMCTSQETFRLPRMRPQIKGRTSIKSRYPAHEMSQVGLRLRLRLCFDAPTLHPLAAAFSAITLTMLLLLPYIT